MQVLLVDDEPAILHFLKRVVTNAGHEVTTAQDGEEGWKLFQEIHPDLIVSDLKMPNLTGLELLRKVRGRSHETIFILMTGAGSPQDAVDALEYGANNYLVKPFTLDSIRSLLGRYNKIVRGRQYRDRIASMVNHRSLTLHLPNEVNLIHEVTEFLLSEVHALIPEDYRFGIHLGLHELLMNAVEHGNLAITFEEKHNALIESPNRLAELIAERAQDPRYKDRRVMIDFFMDGDHFEWLIEDEGEGFDYRAHSAGSHTMDEHSLNGRGIFLARFHFTDLEYIGNGNRVRAVWNKKMAT